MQPVVQPADDASAVRVAQTGGLDGQVAFESLIDRHGPWLVRLLHHLLGRSQADAEDVAQEVLVRAFISIRDCRDGSRFQAWLRTIARHHAFNHRRGAQTRDSYERQAGRLAPDFARAPDASVEARQVIGRVMERMSYPFREIMILRYVEHLELREIAQTLEVGESAAKMRLQRARREFERLHGEMTTV